MSNEVCNSCGAPDAISLCSHCGKTPLCIRCKPNHEPYCEVAQKMKARGEGPTIMGVPQGEHRRGHETPLDTTRRTTMPVVFGAPYDFSKPSLTFDEGIARLNGSIIPNPLVSPISLAPVDQGLAGVKDLLSE